MSEGLTAIVFGDLVDRVQRIPCGDSITRDSIKNVLLYFASSVNLHAQPGKEWQPSENTEKPEGVIKNASKLGLLAATPDEGTVIVTELGLRIKAEIVNIFK